MPATDGLSPPLSPAEREIVKSSGGWTNFVQSYGLDPTDEDDIAEAKNILESFVQADEDAKLQEQE